MKFCAGDDAILRDATRLTRLLAALNEPASIGTYLDRILSTISEIFLVDIAILLDPDGKGDFGSVASLGLPEGIETLPFDDSWAAQVFKALHDGPILEAPNDHDPRQDALIRELGIEASAIIPVAGSQELRGALLLARCKSLPFNREEIDLLSAMAYRIGLALEQIDQKAQLELLARSVKEIVKHPDESSIMEEAVKFFALLVRADAAALLGRVPAGGLACERTTAELGAAETAPIRLASLLDEGASEAGDIRCFTKGEGAEAIAEDLEYPCEALLAAPVPIAGRGVKWLLALRRRPIAFGEGSRRIASLYASQVGSFLGNAALYGELRLELGERAKAEIALRENEETLRARQDELQKMVATRDRLFSIIGHDLRGPFGSMCSLLHYIVDEPKKYGPEERNYILSEVLQAGENITLLLNNLMEWGKAQQADIELQPRPLGLRLCVEEVFALLYAQAAAKGVELVDEIDPRLSLVLDEDSLQTILRNLAANAVKFSNTGDSVTVSAAREGDRVQIIVADTGVGMDAETLRLALDPTSRRSSRGTKGEKGIGLGLILCRDLAEMNGGSIRIESESGKGTTVTIELPARAPDSP